VRIQPLKLELIPILNSIISGRLNAVQESSPLKRAYLVPRFALLALCLLAWPGNGARAVVYESQREALERTFPDADRIERRSFVLTDAQAAEISRLSRAPLESKLVAVHSAWRGDILLGHALIDVHTVRTLPEALLIVLSPERQVVDVRVLAFHEPTDYQPAERWYRQFSGRSLDARLQLMAGIDAISGATLSARAATRSVRRALAVQQVLLQDRFAGTGE
jgi:hypothetical protein